MRITWKFLALAVVAGVIGGLAYDLLKGEGPWRRFLPQ